MDLWAYSLGILHSMHLLPEYIFLQICGGDGQWDCFQKMFLIKVISYVIRLSFVWPFPVIINLILLNNNISGLQLLDLAHFFNSVLFIELYCLTCSCCRDLISIFTEPPVHALPRIIVLCQLRLIILFLIHAAEYKGASPMLSLQTETLDKHTCCILQLYQANLRMTPLEITTVVCKGCKCAV